jgi:diketogulonate reductase-like aldo/keto reductase
MAASFLYSPGIGFVNLSNATMNRRDCLQQIKALGFLSLSPHQMWAEQTILKRLIPSTREELPVVGVGTWQTFDVGESDTQRDPLKEVLKTLLSKGGTVIDSSPMYGRSEEVVGDLSSELNVNDKLFMATKVWTTGKESGIRQMNTSLRLMRRKTIELMQIHNLTDWETHIKTLRQWKDEGKIKYVGLTHYTESAHDRLASIIAREPVDFIQINYNLVERNAEKKLLPFAREKKVAVIINQPFESGSLFRRVKGKALPQWAKEFDCHSWAQFFLKFILSNPAVTCVIPGTDNPRHMLDNMRAGFGRMPSEKQRQDMIKMVG